MASANRERNIIKSVRCPRCLAGIGELCHINQLARQQSPGPPYLSPGAAGGMAGYQIERNL